MPGLDALIAAAGGWRGTNHLQDPMNNVLNESAATANVTPILGGRFVRIDYTWAYQDQGQEGSIIVGFQAKKALATAHWVDSWHMGTVGMACEGTVDEAGGLDLRGSYSVPGHPDWGWRTVLTPATESLQIVMYNVSPEGQEDLAVEMKLTR